jgi:hypothetical protein
MDDTERNNTIVLNENLFPQQAGVSWAKGRVKYPPDDISSIQVSYNIQTGGTVT